MTEEKRLLIVDDEEAFGGDMPEVRRNRWA